MLLLGAVAVVAGWLIANLNLLLSVQFLFLALCIAAVCGLLWLSSRPFFDELSALVGLLEQSEERGDWLESYADTVDRDLTGLSRALQGLLRSMAEREAALMATQNELELRVSEVAISNGYTCYGEGVGVGHVHSIANFYQLSLRQRHHIISKVNRSASRCLSQTGQRQRFSIVNILSCDGICTGQNCSAASIFRQDGIKGAFYAVCPGIISG